MYNKPLSLAESNDSKFVQDMLRGDSLGGVAVATILNINGKFTMFEYLLCEETQVVNPHTSHPNRYWHKNKGKFIALKNIANKLNADLFLVNYAKPNTKHGDKVKIIKVIESNTEGITKERVLNLDKKTFQDFIDF